MIFGLRNLLSERLRPGSMRASARVAEAIDVVETLGRQRRLIDGMIARAAKRVEDTAAYTYDGHRSAAELCEKLVGVASGEAKRAISTAAKLESLPLTDAAVRAGRVSSRQAELDCRNRGG